MSNSDFFRLNFSSGETVSQGIVHSAETLEQNAQQADQALATLYGSGLQGVLLTVVTSRSSTLLNTMRDLIRRIAHAGRDLQNCCGKARLLIHRCIALDAELHTFSTGKLAVRQDAHTCRFHCRLEALPRRNAYTTFYVQQQKTTVE